jgi:formamidopyrimidine-DNA glycosylase
MPELPEVETIRLGLQKYLVGHKIQGVEVFDRKIFTGREKDIVGAKIIAVRRFGKGLVIDLDNDYSIAVHIKLTGQLIYRGEETKNILLSDKVGGLPSKFTRVIFNLDKGARLFFNDIRRFAWMKIIKSSDVKNLPFFKEMGPEPFSGLTQEKFEEIIRSSKTVIKPLLMDQKKIGGVGNIYANEALFLAGINPKRKAENLSDEEIRRLYKAILEVLKKGLSYGGATEINFVNAFGQEGSYQKHFLVYGREGEPCKKCREKIQKIFLGGRGTYFCPKCQA